jgi:hypothetical protein
MALVETSNRAGLASIADLTDESFDILHSTLNTASSGEKDIAALVSQSLTLPVNKGREIVSSLMTLISYNLQEADIPRFVKDVSTEMSSGNASTRVAPEKSAVFQQRLLTLLRVEPMRVLSKARALLFENPQMFQSARVMTDLRPVFGTEAELHVSGAIVKHDLKIEFADRSGYKEFFVTMDDADVRSLKLTLERAERKALVLRSLLQKCQVSDLNPGEPESNA